MKVAMGEHLNYGGRISRRLILVLILVLYSLMTFLILIYERCYPGSDLGRIWFLLLWLIPAVIFFGYTMSRILLYRIIKNHPDRDAWVEWDISEEFLLSRIKDKIKSESTWGRIIKMIETKKGFLVYMKPTLYHWWPRHAFSSEEDINQLGSWAKQKTQKFFKK